MTSLGYSSQIYFYVVPRNVSWPRVSRPITVLITQVLPAAKCIVFVLEQVEKTCNKNEEFKISEVRNPD